MWVPSITRSNIIESKFGDLDFLKDEPEEIKSVLLLVKILGAKKLGATSNLKNCSKLCPQLAQMRSYLY